MKNSDKPAYPNQKGAGESIPISGLTKREYFAGLAMQAILTGIQTEPIHETISKWAIESADELLKQLEK